MREAHIITALGGAATRQQLVAAGCSGYDITRAVRAGQIIRCRQARYILPSTPRDVAAAVRVGGMLAGPSAARSYGLWAGTDRRLHISVGANASRLRTNLPPSFHHQPLTPDRSSHEIVLHWLRSGAPPELGPECWRVTLPDCLRQVVTWCDRTDAIACLETALTTQGWSTRQLASVFRSETIASRLVVSAARMGSDSGPESLVCQRLRRRGLVLRQQVRIQGVGRVDIGVVGTRVIVEVDGRTYHEDPVAFEEDRRRDAELVARGHIVVRLSYRRVMDDWPWCERMVLAAIASH